MIRAVGGAARAARLRLFGFADRAPRAMDVGAYIRALPPHLAAPGAFQARAILEVSDPATVQHILQTFHAGARSERVVHFRAGAPSRCTD